MAKSAPTPVANAVTIAASPQTVDQLITDLPTLATLAEEVESMSWRKGSCARPGAVFKGYSRNGGRQWSTTCTVTEAEPGETFAFDVRLTVLPVAHWRYDIESLCTGGCRVTVDPGLSQVVGIGCVVAAGMGAARSGARSPPARSRTDDPGGVYITG